MCGCGTALYLVAVLDWYSRYVLDWYSRYVLAWELSNTLDTNFCLEALEGTFRQGQPHIFNTDQGVQFTSAAYTERLERAGIQISWDGRGRALDNVFVSNFPPWHTCACHAWLPQSAERVNCLIRRHEVAEGG